ncbi:MAG TPA: sialate O-acetylesterase [Puia sp.]|nr:sialate O-acetylesterase [Puia sp.]
MKFLLTILFVFLYVQAFSQLHLSAIFSDHMILQRDKPLKIWGTAGAGEMVNISLKQVKASARAGNDGKWLITMPAFSAGGPHILTIKSGNETKIFSDVLFGEVWICSGQSNMEFRVKQAMNAKYELHRANNPLIRQVSIPHKLTFHPEEFVDSTQWVISTPETTGEFTAVGYFFARDIFEHLRVPIGLIYDNWGGSQVESWISGDAMMGSDELKDYVKQMPGNWDASNARVEKEIISNLKKLNGEKMPVTDEAIILKADYNFSGWMPSAVPTSWDWIGLPSYRGEGYMLREIMVDSIQASLPSVLSLGLNDIRFRWFVNGNAFPRTTDKIFTVSLPPYTWKAGRNLLLLEIGPQQVPDWWAMGVRGENDQIYLDFDGERFSLVDEKWKMLPTLNKPHHYMQWMNNEGTIIYNGMLHPIIPYSIRGVLWYQGENNTDRAVEYGKTFPLMIESWRKEWNDPFPFLFVQLADFGSNESSNAGSKWAELRESQTKTLRLSNTGMSVTADIGDPKDIHPKNKQEVGRRLAAIALNDVYGFNQTCNGPQYDSVYFSRGKATLFFKSTGKGLIAKDKNGYLRGFEIAGPDRKFYYARAFIQGKEIVVSADSVENPLAVRYGWSNAPDDINLYNADGFPASPFRTDHWPGITDSVRFFKK